jgi:hypothetical protein
MTIEAEPRPATRFAPPSWGAVADAVGHCVVVFAFLPALAVVPRWLYFEATNALNRSEPVVLVFLPVRGFLRLLNGFAQGAAHGVVAGVIAGIVLSAALMRWRAADGWRRAVLGAASGAVAAALAALLLRVAGLDGLRAPGDRATLQIALGALCGVIAVPTAVRLLWPADDAARTAEQDSRASA